MFYLSNCLELHKKTSFVLSTDVNVVEKNDSAVANIYCSMQAYLQARMNLYILE